MRTILGVLVVMAALLPGCGGDDSDGQAGGTGGGASAGTGGGAARDGGGSGGSVETGGTGAESGSSGLGGLGGGGGAAGGGGLSGEGGTGGEGGADGGDTQDAGGDAGGTDGGETGSPCPALEVYHPGSGRCVSTEDLHADCANDPTCHQGQECVRYYGIAGNPFDTCELTCGDLPERLCPEGYGCIDISDGPQNVCMP